MKKIGKKYFNLTVKAYLSLEASYVMPLLIFLIVFMCVFCFYLYNCCIVFQACYISALRGSQIINASNDEVKTRVEDYLDELLDNQIYDYIKQVKVEVGLFQIKTCAEAKTNNNFNSIDVISGIDMTSDYKAYAIKTYPVKLIRMTY